MPKGAISGELGGGDPLQECREDEWGDQLRSLKGIKSSRGDFFLSYHPMTFSVWSYNCTLICQCNSKAECQWGLIRDE